MLRLAAFFRNLGRDGELPFTELGPAEAATKSTTERESAINT